jgi:Phage integrase SAM-like domain
MHYHVPQPFYRKDRKTWYVQIRGRQVSLGKDRSQAFQRYYEIMARPDDVLSTELTSTAGMLLSQLFDQFLDWVQRNRAKPTYEWYRYRLQRFSDKFPKLTIEQLRPYNVQQWVDGYQNHSRTSNRNYMRTVKRCLTWAHRLGYIDRNPLAALELPAAESKDVYFPPEQFKEFLDHAVDQCVRDIMVVTYECGCRPKNRSGLKSVTSI